MVSVKYRQTEVVHYPQLPEVVSDHKAITGQKPTWQQWQLQTLTDPASLTAYVVVFPKF